MKYHEFEKTVFEWLMKKNQEDSNFTFSVRKSPSKGSELDYFIGTEKSSYFGMTFWTIPVGFPGSASDLIDLFFMEDKGYYHLYFQFNQTKSPHDAQNSYALELIRNLKPIISNHYKDSFFESKSAKYERFSILWETSKSDSVDTLLNKLEKELKKIIGIVDEEIEKATIKHPDFKAHRITADEFNTMIAKMERRFEKYKKNGGKDSGGDEDTEEVSTKTENIISSNPNIILYGPPGTGKTYNTIELAYELIKDHRPKKHEIAQEFFKQERGNRIEFITFHQNYAYEDFVQGLKPDYNSSQLRFSKVDGIFKNICTNAIFEYLVLAKRSAPAKVSPDFNTIFSAFVDWLKSEGLENVQIKTTEGNPIIIKDIANDKYIHASHGESDVKHTVSATRLEALFNKFQNIDQIKSISKDITETIGGCNTSMYWAIFNEFLNFKNRNIDDIEQVEQALESEVLDIEEKKQRISNFGLEKLSKFIEKNNPEVPSYVLIIDEINRANISRVFGELITLIEKDKRLGQLHELTVNLPGGDEFAIPPNLYIVGTMNTADKSIALVDIALRRRFEFKKKYPLYHIEGQKINYSEQLEKVNKKIRELKNADFQIGHSYFMGNDFNLKYTMNNKVIPLLYEYFMNDTDLVKEVLEAGSFQYKDENTTDSGLIEFIDQSSETKEKASEESGESESES